MLTLVRLRRKRSLGVLSLTIDKRLFLLLFLGLFLVSCTTERTIVLPDAASKAYGFVFFHDEDIARELVLGSANVYVPINFSSGCTSLNMVCDSWNVTIERQGIYMLDYHTSFENGANREFHVSAGLNGVAKLHECHSSRKIGTGGDIGSMSGNCILTLSLGDVISLLVENEAAPTPIFIKDFSFSVVKI